MHPVYRQMLALILGIISIVVSCNRCQQRQAKQEWTPELESQVREIFYSQSSQLVTDEKAKREYADCCLSKMKVLFPNGIGNSSSQLNDSVKMSVMKMGLECAQTFEGHLNIWNEETKKQLELQLYSMEEAKSLPKKYRAEYIDCVLFKVTTEYPNGLGDSNKKILKKFMAKAREDCLIMVSNKYMKAQKLK